MGLVNHLPEFTPDISAAAPILPTIIQMAVSCIYGVGYTLLQDHGFGHLHLVQCSSRFLTDVETRYITIDQEMVAIVGVMAKCMFYLFIL